MSVYAETSGFGRVWAASLLSNLSDGVRAAAFPLLAAAMTRDPVLVAGVAIAQQIPWLISGPLAGVVVDRVDRKRILGWVNAARALAFAGLAVSLVTGTTALWMLYLTAFLLGVGESLYDNAAQSIIPQLVASHRLEHANGRLVAAEVVGNEFAGPPIGALLFGVAAVLPFVSSTVALGVAVLLVVSISGSFRADPPEAAMAKGAWRQVIEGFRFVAAHRELRTITVLAGVLSASDAAWFAILVLFSLDVLGFTEAGFGVLLAAGAVGGVLGALTVERMAHRWSTRVLVAGTLVLSAATQTLLGLSNSAVAAVFLVAASSLAFGVWNVIAVSLRQRAAPSHLLGRVNATYRTVAMGAAPIGAVLGGLAGEGLGLRAPFFVGVPPLMVGAIMALSRLRSDPPPPT